MTTTSTIAPPPWQTQSVPRRLLLLHLALLNQELRTINLVLLLWLGIMVWSDSRHGFARQTLQL